MDAPSEREIALTARVNALACVLLQVMEVMARGDSLVARLPDMEKRLSHLDELPSGLPLSQGWSDASRTRQQEQARHAALELTDGLRQALQLPPRE